MVATIDDDTSTSSAWTKYNAYRRYYSKSDIPVKRIAHVKEPSFPTKEPRLKKKTFDKVKMQQGRRVVKKVRIYRRIANMRR